MGRAAKATLGIMALLVVASLGSPAQPRSTTLEPRPVAVTQCEKAYAAMAYRWDDREADPTSDPVAFEAFEPDLYMLAILEFCSFDELDAAADKFLVHRGVGYQGSLVRYWTPSMDRLRFNECATDLGKDTRLCREIVIRSSR